MEGGKASDNSNYHLTLLVIFCANNIMGPGFYTSIPTHVHTCIHKHSFIN